MSDPQFYYDINVQVWKEHNGVVYWSVIQEHDEAGADEEPLAWGETDSVEDAVELAKAAVTMALTPFKD